MSGLPRELLKWLQSLDLMWQVKCPKWDLSNGYLVAEIFSWYYPLEIETRTFTNGKSLQAKLDNWVPLRNFFKKHKFDIPTDCIEGTIHCKEGAAHVLAEKIYECLTNRPVKRAREIEIDFTDRRYQQKLPMHARATALQSVKTNITMTELMADQSILVGQYKAQEIINNHVQYRRLERLEDPQRFGRKPTLGELAPRSAPTGAPREDTNISQGQPMLQNTSPKGQQGLINQGGKETSVHFREVQVHQLDKHGQPFSGSAVTGY